MKPGSIFALILVGLLTITMLGGASIHAQTHTTTYGQAQPVSMTVSPTVKKLQSEKPVITVILYSNGWVKINATERFNTTSTGSITTIYDTMVKFLKNKTIIKSYEKLSSPEAVPTPIPGQSHTNTTVKVRVDGKRENGALRGNFHAYVNAYSYNFKATGVFAIKSQDNETIIDTNATIKGSNATLAKIVGYLEVLNSTTIPGLSVERLVVDRNGDTMSLSVRIRYQQSGFTGVTGLGPGAAISFSEMIAIGFTVSIGVADEIHYNYVMKPGMYESNSTIVLHVGFNKLAKMYADYMIKVERAYNITSENSITSLLYKLGDEYEVEEGGVLHLVATSNMMLASTPKIRKIGTTDPLETLKSLADLIASNLPGDEKNDFLNTTIHLKPGDKGIKKIEPDTVKIKDLDKVKVETATSSKTVTLAATAVIAVIILAAAVALARRF